MLIWGSAVVLLVLVASLMLATSGTYPMPKTVAGNPDLPALELDDVRLHGRIQGADGPLMIVLHGGPGGDHRSLLPLQELGDDCRILFFDQRGAGLSERVAAEALTIADYLRDLDALVDRYAEGRRVILIGHSWGAMLAVAFVGHRPDAVARAVLIEPGFLDTAGYAAWEARRGRLARSPRLMLAGLLAGFRAQNADPVDAAAQHDFLTGSVVHAFANHPKNPYHCPGEPYDAPSWRFGGAASDQFWADPQPAIAAMGLGLGQALPVLFLAGGCNEWTGEALQRRHAVQFPNTSVEVIPGAGHDVVSDQPAAALRAIRAFLATT